jgi:hypothetical protein
MTISFECAHSVKTANAELSGIFSQYNGQRSGLIMLEKISGSNVCSRRLRWEQTWSKAQLRIRAAAGGANKLISGPLAAAHSRFARPLIVGC